MTVGITDPGPKNPLFFFSFALLGKIPNFTPNDTEVINHLECIAEIIADLPEAVFVVNSLGKPVSVTCDALLVLMASESKRPLNVRRKATECLYDLIKRLAVNINGLNSVLPGVLSKAVKVVIGRVDTEDHAVLLSSLKIIEECVEAFWNKQADWQLEDIVTKERFKINLDSALASLKPLILAESRIGNKSIQSTLFHIFRSHLIEGFNQRSRTAVLLLQHAALNNIQLEAEFSNIIYTEYAALMEWFDSTSSFDEEVRSKLVALLGVANSAAAKEIISTSQIFSLVFKPLLQLSKTGTLFDVHFSQELSGPENMHLRSDASLPVIAFKRTHHRFHVKSLQLFQKISQIDREAVANELVKIDDALLQIDLASEFIGEFDSLAERVFSDCMRHIRSVPTLPIDQGQLIQLAAIKLLSSRFSRAPFSQSQVQQYLSFMLICSSSSWLVLRDVATELLRFLAKRSSTDLPGFLRSHQDFILDRLGIQLSKPGLFPEVPNIIAVLLEHLIDAPTVIKFSDLMVNKIGENLTVYRTHSAHCKGLLQAASGAIKKLDSDESILALLRIAQFFILADSKSVRVAALGALSAGVDSMAKNKEEPSELCQLIHTAWPNIIAIIEDILQTPSFGVTKLDVNVIEAASNCIKSLCSKCPIFLRDRIAKDYWRGLLMKRKSFNSNRIAGLLIDALTLGVECCLLGTEVLLEIITKYGQMPDVNVNCLFDAINKVEPDAVWYFYHVQCGVLTGLAAPAPELRSFSNFSDCRLSTHSAALKNHLSILFK